MIIVTESAIKEVEDYFKLQKKIAPIRIFWSSG